jgi:hypothetical protein
MTEKKPDKAQQRSFTGDKLDWMAGVSADPRLDARAFEVAFCIAQHINQQSGLARLSDETIADKTGIPKRWIARARAALREAGWIDWRRTGDANIYWTKGEPLNAVLDHQAMLKDGRDEKRKKRKTIIQDQPPVAYPDAPPVANRDSPPVAHIHLQSYTFTYSPSKIDSSPRRKL